MSKFKNVYPEVDDTFGKLTFAGLGEEKRRRVNGRPVVQEREYNLYSSFKRAENVEVRIPGRAGAKNFGYEDEVKLVNARLIAEGYNIDGRGMVNYVLAADDIVEA